MVALRSKFILPCDFGDAVSALHVNAEYIVCGTLLGKIWLYNIQRNSRLLLSGFSDDSVRGVYIEDGTVFATIGDQYCKRIRITDPLDQLDAKFDRRSSSSGFKYVLQKFNQVTIVYPGMTTFVDVTNNQQSMCPYKIQQPLVLNVCPLDAFQCLLLVSEFPSLEEGEQSHRKLKVVDVSQNLTLFEMLAPKVTLAIFLDAKRIMYTFSNGRVFVLNFETKEEVFPNVRIHRSGSEIISASVDGDGRVTSLATDGSVCVWEWMTGRVLTRTRVTGVCFSLGFPYLVQSSQNLVAVSSDYGVHIVPIASADSVV